MASDNFEAVIETCLARERSAPRWIQDLRAEALNDWRALSPPTLKSEEYRYTNIKPLLTTDYAERESGKESSEAEHRGEAVSIERYTHPDEHTFVILDDEPVTGEKLAEHGVRVMSMKQAIQSEETLLREFAKKFPAQGDYFRQLANICWHDGIFVQIEAEANTKPLHLVHVTTSGARFRQNVFDIRGQAQIIESHIGGNDTPYLSSTRTLMMLGKNARCNYVKVQDEGQQAFHLSFTECRQEEGSRLEMLSLSNGGQIARLETTISKDAPRTVCDFRAIYFGKKTQVLDNYSQITHSQPAGQTTQQIRGIVKDRARGIFSGNIRVLRAAQQTDASQLTKNLLVGDECAAYVKPQLQIEADDVKCTHGATSATLAERDLLYLTSRGIAEHEARQLLCRAHIEELTRTLPVLSARRFCEQMLGEFFI